MNYDQIRLPEEIKLRNDLYNALQADAIMRLATIAEHPITHQIEDCLEDLSSRCYLVTEESAPRYFRLFKEVCQRLEFDEDIRFYIEPNSELNAYSILKQGEQPHAIVIYSMALKLLNDDEIRMMIGHEMGHLILRQGELQPLLRILEEQISVNPSLKHKVTLWKQLSELSADRFGYLAEPNLLSMISSQMKFSSGLSLEELIDDYNINIDYALNNAESVVDVYYNNFGVTQDAHPIEAIRLMAVKYFSDSIIASNNGYNDDVLQEKMSIILTALDNVVSDKMELMKARFHASAGLIVAQSDGRINADELDHIYNNLSQYQIFPKRYLEKIAQKDYYTIFDDSIKFILENNKYNNDVRLKILHRLISISFSDQNVHSQEIDIILRIATQYLGFTQKQAARIYLDAVNKHFMPNPEDVF